MLETIGVVAIVAVVLVLTVRSFCGTVMGRNDQCICGTKTCLGSARCNLSDCQREGGSAPMNKVTFSISGMSRGTCAEELAKNLRVMVGIQTVDVNLVLTRATVKYDPAVVDPSMMKKTIGKLGFIAAEMRKSCDG